MFCAMKESNIALMEVCGTHTMAIARSGIKKLLPEFIRLISGPGCPVCVTSQSDIDKAVNLAGRKDVIMATFGDMMRVPGTFSSLANMKRNGADVQVVYSCLDALKIACSNPQKKIVFMGVGFETTSPTVAQTILEAKKRKIKNFFLLSNFKLIFPALRAICSMPDIKVDGFICPGHVSVITGADPYEKFAKTFKKACVITGFDDVDILKGIKRLVLMIKDGKYGVEIEYKRAVSKKGNPKAREILSSVFEETDSFWRGIGNIKGSGLHLRKEFESFDAEKEFNVKVPKPVFKKGCICGDVLCGKKTPEECALFGKACTPQNPIGPCMVSSEGSCAAYYKYGE
ncbi:MAG: hydrogenase formation protein HypD [Candidatus Omnitrophica bacterium]|nr:hydrogenase formation protein HypD [Candidatus Omnitrophota bacterium]